jgi:hypothetical protein
MVLPRRDRLPDIHAGTVPMRGVPPCIPIHPVPLCHMSRSSGRTPAPVVTRERMNTGSAWVLSRHPRSMKGTTLSLVQTTLTAHGPTFKPRHYQKQRMYRQKRINQCFFADTDAVAHYRVSGSSVRTLQRASRAKPRAASITAGQASPSTRQPSSGPTRYNPFPRRRSARWHRHGE